MIAEVSSGAGSSSRTIARVAVGLGIVAVASVIGLGLFFAVGDPFDTIDDAGNALIGIVGALLAWMLAGVLDRIAELVRSEVPVL